MGPHLTSILSIRSPRSASLPPLLSFAPPRMFATQPPEPRPQTCQPTSSLQKSVRQFIPRALRRNVAKVTRSMAEICPAPRPPLHHRARILAPHRPLRPSSIRGRQHPQRLFQNPAILPPIVHVPHAYHPRCNCSLRQHPLQHLSHMCRRLLHPHYPPPQPKGVRMSYESALEKAAMASLTMVATATKGRESVLGPRYLIRIQPLLTMPILLSVWHWMATAKTHRSGSARLP